MTKDIRRLALTTYYPYGKNKEKIIAERTKQVDKAISEHDSEIRADERRKFAEWCKMKGYSCYDWRMLIEEYEKEQKNG